MVNVGSTKQEVRRAKERQVSSNRRPIRMVTLALHCQVVEQSYHRDGELCVARWGHKGVILIGYGWKQLKMSDRAEITF